MHPFFNLGNCLGDEGINQVKSQLESHKHLEMLGSMSEDEGDEDDDEDEDDGLGDEDGDGSEGEESHGVSLEVKGVTLKAQSPLLGDDEEVEKELIKVLTLFTFSVDYFCVAHDVLCLSTRICLICSMVPVSKPCATHLSFLYGKCQVYFALTCH